MRLLRKFYSNFLQLIYQKQNKAYLAIGWKREVMDFCHFIGQDCVKATERIKSIDPRLAACLEISDGHGLESLYLTLGILYLIDKEIDIRNILEIGTGMGDNANLLAKLVPEAVVHTIDLPSTDPNFINSSARDPVWRKCLKEGTIDEDCRFYQNLNVPNIKSYLRNSLHLNSIFDFEKKRFELIWMDGAHWYPAVAWDFAFAYNSLSADGVIFIDDWTVADKNKSPLTGRIDQNAHTDIDSLMQYVRGRIPEKIWRLPRHHIGKKYVAAIIKS